MIEKEHGVKINQRALGRLVIGETSIHRFGLDQFQNIVGPLLNHIRLKDLPVLTEIIKKYKETEHTKEYC